MDFSKYDLNTGTVSESIGLSRPEALLLTEKMFNYSWENHNATFTQCLAGFHQQGFTKQFGINLDDGMHCMVYSYLFSKAWTSHRQALEMVKYYKMPADDATKFIIAELDKIYLAAIVLEASELDKRRKNED